MYDTGLKRTIDHLTQGLYQEGSASNIIPVKGIMPQTSVVVAVTVPRATKTDTGLDVSSRANEQKMEEKGPYRVS